MATLHIFGGGTALIQQAIQLAQAVGWEASVRTSPRLWDPGDALAQQVKSMGVTVVCEEKLEAAMAGGPPIGAGDVALSYGAPWIFRQAWIDQWNGGAFNYHPRRLPENRGGGGSSWAILMGDRLGRACFHQLTAGIDDGPIVAVRSFEFSTGARFPVDFDQETEVVAELLQADWLPEIFEGQHHGGGPNGGQPEDLSTYWPRLNTAVHGWVDWSWERSEIMSFLHAFGPPYSGAQTFLRGCVVRLSDARMGDARVFHPFQFGLIYRMQDGRVHVACRGGGLTLRIEEAATGDSQRPRLGDRLVTPREELEAAMASRVSYDAAGNIARKRADRTAE